MKRARNRKSKNNENTDIYSNIPEENTYNIPESAQEEENTEDFALPDNMLESINDSAVTGHEYDSAPESEIPFSAEIFEPSENTKEPEAENISGQAPVPHSEDFLKRKAMNKKKFEKKRKKRRIITVCTGVFLLLIAACTIILGFDFSGNDLDNSMAPVDTETGKLNVLLLGVDKDGERSDSIMLVSYSFDDHSIKLLSVPRDTRMYVTDREVTRKITEVHGMHNSAGKMYGAAAVAESVTSLTGIPINYYVEFSFDALDNIMDILGPVTFDVPDIEGGGRGMNYDDGYQDLHIHLKPGLQELSGNQIQQFLRYRKSNYGTSDGSDISRVARQQELLKAIIDQKVNLELIVKIPDLFKEIKSQLKTNFGVSDVIKYAGHLKNISSENMHTYVLPGESALTGGAWYYVCDLDATAELVTNTFGYPVTSDELSNEISLTGKKPSGSSGKSSSSSSKSSGSSNKSSGSSDSGNSSSEKSSSKNTSSDNDTSSKNTSTKNTDTSSPSKNNSSSKTDNSSSESSSSQNNKNQSSGNETSSSNTSSSQTGSSDSNKTPSKTDDNKTDSASDSKTDSSKNDSTKNEANSEKTPSDSSSSNDTKPSSDKSDESSDEAISLD